MRASPRSVSARYHIPAIPQTYPLRSEWKPTIRNRRLLLSRQVFAKRTKKGREKGKRKSGQAHLAATVFSTRAYNNCVYLIGSGAQQRSIVDDRLLEYTRSYRSVVGDSWEGKDDIEVERMDDAASTIVGERRYLELILIGRYRWIVMVIVEDNLPSTMANIVARRLFIVNISRPTVPNIAYS